mmetsp:Transcript_68299/g.160609  ORF Transcript_68299/g.160609 Transcript_68299/m.160609 type:complete len:96 (+) Transcript_68299:629-916(+)
MLPDFHFLFPAQSPIVQVAENGVGTLQKCANSRGILQVATKQSRSKLAKTAGFRALQVATQHSYLDIGVRQLQECVTEATALFSGPSDDSHNAHA